MGSSGARHGGRDWGPGLGISLRGRVVEAFNIKPGHWRLQLKSHQSQVVAYSKIRKIALVGYLLGTLANIEDIGVCPPAGPFRTWTESDPGRHAGIEKHQADPNNRVTRPIYSPIVLGPLANPQHLIRQPNVARPRLGEQNQSGPELGSCPPG